MIHHDTKYIDPICGITRHLCTRAHSVTLCCILKALELKNSRACNSFVSVQIPRQAWLLLPLLSKSNSAWTGLKSSQGLSFDWSDSSVLKLEQVDTSQILCISCWYLKTWNEHLFFQFLKNGSDTSMWLKGTHPWLDAIAWRLQTKRVEGKSKREKPKVKTKTMRSTLTFFLRPGGHASARCSQEFSSSVSCFAVWWLWFPKYGNHTQQKALVPLTGTKFYACTRSIRYKWRSSHWSLWQQWCFSDGSWISYDFL